MPLYTGDETIRPMQGITSLGASQGEALEAAGTEAMASWPLAQASGAIALDAAKRSPQELQMLYPEANPEGIDIPKPEQVPMAAAKAKVKDAGLEGALHLPEQDSIPAPALDIMLDRARARRERETTIARGPGGFMAGALSVGTSFLVGAADPLNLAAGFIPVVGEARYAKLLASAGESALGRATVRGGVGAAQGAAGTAPLIGLEAYAHTQEGQDYGMADALRSLVMNAGLGGVLHAGGGAVADVYRSSKGIPLYPFAPMRRDAQGRVTPAEPFAGQQPGAPAPPSPIATAVADLPPRAKEDVLHASLANIIEGKPVQASEILTAAAQTDPRIAESLQIPQDHAGIFDDVRQRLMAAGMPEDEAATNAAIWADRYTTRAQRLGQPAWGLYQGEGVDIRRRTDDAEALAEGRSFQQPATPVASRQHGIPAAADPPISSYGNTRPLTAHADYAAAKAGDRDAAARMVSDLVRPETIEAARQRFGADAVYVPVHAEEQGGRNAIPAALAHFYAASTGASVDANIVQGSRAFHTGASAVERLIARPTFHGPVEPGRRYVIVDDVSVMGNTLAELANHIQAGGGEVGGVVTLANSSRLAHNVPAPQRLKLLEERHGDVIRQELGISPGALTAAEAEYLLNFRTPDTLRDRIAKARLDRGERLLSKGVQPSAAEGEVAPPRSFNQSQPAATPFYSAVERAVSSIKQERASPEQWLATLRNMPGVKGEELQWLGLEDWLKEQKGPVTRQQVADYVRANRIEVTEIQKGGDPPGHEAIYRLNALLADKYGSLTDAFQHWTPEEEAHYDRLSEAASSEVVSDPKYADYTLPGGENYRELLLTLPSGKTDALPPEWTVREEPDGGYYVYNTAGQMVAGGALRAHAIDNALMEISRGSPRAEGRSTEQHRSAHWEEPNVLAHIRFDDRVADGKKTLHLAEVQSDWHQAGRRHGYGDDPGQEKRLRDALAAATQHQIAVRDEFTATTHGTHAAEEAFARYEQALEAENHAAEALQRFAPTSRVPDAPFKTTWPELALKRMIRYAAEHGYDRISWDTGETNAERYDLSKQVDKVTYAPDANHLRAWKNGAVVIRQTVTPEKLPDHIGKDVAQKLIQQPLGSDPAFKGAHDEKVHSLSGLELKVGGEGMLGFYDDILPKAAAKLTKKFGGKVEHSTLSPIDRSRWEIEEGEDRRGNQEFEIRDNSTHETVGVSFQTRAAAQAEIDKLAGPENVTPVHSLDVTPAMRAAAMSEGFPLFQRGAGDELRGRITLQNQKAIIDLFAKADRSTFMHESAHLWLDEMMRDTAGESVPDTLKADRDAILKWLGVDRAEDIGTSQHEQWARGFEQYLMEGNAPSSALVGVFAKFKQWLTAIYQHLTSLGQPISDDIRSVFDRMLATDEQIAQQELGGRPIAATLPSQAARTGNPAIDAILENPITQRNIDHPLIVREHTVPYTAGGSVPLENPVMFIDYRFPKEFEQDDKKWDPAEPFAVHENIEQPVMEALIKAGMDKLLAYKIAHWGWAEPAEGAWYRARGIDQARAEAAYAPYMAAIQHGAADNVPAALYRDPYPHDQPSAARHEALAEPHPTAEEIAQATRILQDAGLVPKEEGAQVVPGPRSARGPRARDPQTYSLFEFLADRGGIRPDPDLAVIFGGKNPFVPGFGRLLRKTGMPLDRAREVAVEAGYLFDPASGELRPTESTLTHLRDALEAENSGQKQYRAGEEKTPGIDRDEEQHRIEGDLDAALTEVGLDATAVTGTLRDRVIQIMRREHVADPLKAYERAVMEEDRRGVETAGTEPVAHTIPGWDVPDELAAAPGPSRPVAVQPGSGDAGAGTAARQPGAGDRGPAGRAAAGPAAQRAAWHDIARAPDPAHEPAAIDAWQVTEKLPEPPSADPGKRLAAIQKDAAAAEAIWAEVSPYLSEDVRQRFDDIIRGLDVETADRSEMIRQGAACLAVATGASA